MKYFSLVFCMFILFNFFTQDLQMDKIDSRGEKFKKSNSKDRTNYPFELSFGYGTLISFNNDKVVASVFEPNFHYKYELPMLEDDTTKFNYYSSYNIGIQKRFGKFRIGLNTQYSLLNDKHENPDQYYYFTDINGTTFLDQHNGQSEVTQNAELIIFNLTSDYLLINSKSIGFSIGLKVGALKFNNHLSYLSSRTDYSYQTSLDFSTGQYITYLSATNSYSQDYNHSNKNFSINLSPSMSLDYKISKAIKAQLSVFYSFQQNNKIKTTGINKVTENGVQISTDLSNSNWINYYKNPSKLGLNLNLIFSLGKEKIYN